MPGREHLGDRAANRAGEADDKNVERGQACRIERRHVDTFAHIVLAASNEVALMIARADDPAAALSAGEGAFAAFLDRLLGGG